LILFGKKALNAEIARTSAKAAENANPLLEIVEFGKTETPSSRNIWGDIYRVHPHTSDAGVLPHSPR